MEMFTNDSLIEVWLEAARTVYEETGMRVDARLSIPYYICDKYENCNLSGPIANYVCMWEPTELESQEDYYVALLQVVRRVRERFRHTLFFWGFKLILGHCVRAAREHYIT